MQRSPHLYLLFSKVLKYERLLSFITVKGHDRVVIIIPESSLMRYGGWWLQRLKTSTLGVFVTNEGTTEQLLKGKSCFKDALHKCNCTLKEAKGGCGYMKNQLSVKTQENDNDLLHRCLVGRFNGEDEVPARIDVRIWAQQT